MSDTIRNLDDLAAERILNAIAKSRARTSRKNIPWDSNLRQALVGNFQVKPGAVPVSEGELARQALLVLAQ